MKLNIIDDPKNIIGLCEAFDITDLEPIHIRNPKNIDVWIKRRMWNIIPKKDAKTIQIIYEMMQWNIKFYNL